MSRSRTLTDATDQALAERFRQGEAEVFDVIIARYETYLNRLAYRLTGWSADSADVVQETLVAAWTQLPHYRGDASLKTWLTGIAIRVARKHQRRDSRWRRWLSTERTPTTEPVSPDNGAVVNEQHARLHAAIRGLTARDREVLVLRYLEEMPIDQIAATLHIKRAALDVRLHRARQRLAEEMGEGATS